MLSKARMKLQLNKTEIKPQRPPDPPAGDYRVQTGRTHTQPAAKSIRGMQGGGNRPPEGESWSWGCPLEGSGKEFLPGKRRCSGAGTASCKKTQPGGWWHPEPGAQLELHIWSWAQPQTLLGGATEQLLQASGVWQNLGRTKCYRKISAANWNFSALRWFLWIFGNGGSILEQQGRGWALGYRKKIPCWGWKSFSSNFIFFSLGLLT